MLTLIGGCRLFADADFLSVLEGPCGIPIGELTSQFFANVYFDDFDHWVKQTLKVPAYLRYVDDLYLLDDCKTRRWGIGRPFVSI